MDNLFDVFHLDFDDFDWNKKILLDFDLDFDYCDDFDDYDFDYFNDFDFDYLDDFDFYLADFHSDYFDFYFDILLLC